jgi:hypothetical protein
MRTQNSLNLKAPVTTKDIEHLLSLRRTFNSQKRRLEMAETALHEFEREITARIQAGATVTSPHEVRLQSIERRNVAWKSVAAELIGHEAAEDILKCTVPSVSYRILIKEAA